MGPEPARPITDNLVCSLWVIDHNGTSCVVKWVDVWGSCLQGNCACSYFVEGAVAQIKPCRVYAEVMCHGDNDPDWEYLLRGGCFGFRVIDPDCVSAYFQLGGKISFHLYSK